MSGDLDGSERGRGSGDGGASREGGSLASDDPVVWWFGRQRFGVRPGLERVRALLGDLGDPQTAFATTLVGGTNGKGTTTVALAACLGAGGVAPVGCFTSPHLERVQERFVVDGAEVSLDELSRGLAAVRPHAEARGATFFEIATALGAWLFAERGVRAAVFEVGLGGRWDATNALEPAQSVITGVALDHVDVLGGDVATIAADKAGILRRGVPGLTGAQGEALDVIERRAAEVDAPLWRLGHEVHATGEARGWAGRTLRVSTPVGEVATTTRLLGRHQERNLALAAAAALQQGVAPLDAAEALSKVSWPGRLERFEHRGRTIVLDGAHNPDAATALVGALRELGAGSYTLLVGVGRDKDVAGIVVPLAGAARAVVATRAARSPRAAAPAAVAEAVGAAAPVLAVCEHPDDGWREALTATPAGGTLLVAGSLYLVGEIRTVLRGVAAEPYERYQ